MSAVFIRKARLLDHAALTDAFAKSLDFHHPWALAPPNMKRFLQQKNLYLVCKKETGEIVGSFNISQIVRGNFHSAYLGYQAFVPHQGKGYMTDGIGLVIDEAFGSLKLHRIEANIQPGNEASIRLVRRAGFKKEGFSPAYLRIGQSWKDHERWALINENWRVSDHL